MPDFPRYPRSGSQAASRESQPAPPAIQRAVQLMYAGAAVSLISLIIGLATAGELKAAIRKQQPKLTPVQVNNTASSLVSAIVVIGVVGTALWLWMAWANGRGLPWARILSSVLFAVSTLNTVVAFAQPGDLLARILTVAVWLIGLGAIALLWRPQSSAFYQASSAPSG